MVPILQPDDAPKQIYDFYGFPEELYNIKYNPTGAKKYAQMVAEELEDSNVMLTAGMGSRPWCLVCTNTYVSQS